MVNNVFILFTSIFGPNIRWSTQGHSIIQVFHLSWTFGDQHLGLSTNILDYRPKIQDFRCVVYNKSKILDYQIDNPRFSICYTSGVENPRFSIDNPSLSTWFWILDYQIEKTWIFALINQDFRFVVHLASKILDYQVIILVFQLFNDILDYQIEKLGFHFDNPGFSTYCTKQVENLGLSTENPSFSEPMSNNLKNLDFRVENLGLSNDNPSFSITYRKSWIINWKSKFFLKILDYQLKILDFRPIIQDFRFIGHWAYHTLLLMFWWSFLLRT